MSFPVGEAASLGAAASWAIGLNLYHRDAREVGARAVNLFKNLLAAALFLLAVLASGAPAVSARGQGLLLLSGVVGLAFGDTFLFFALRRIGAHRAALLLCLAPAFTAAGGWIVLGERLNLAQGAGVLATAGGVAVVSRARPRGAVAVAAPGAAGLAAGVAAALCHSTGVLLAKRGLAEAGPLAGTALRLAGAVAVLALFAFFRRDLVPSLRRLCEPFRLRRLVPAVLVATFAGLWLMQVGIQRTESAVANALHGTTPLFTLPIALFWLRERLPRAAVAGSLAAVAGVLLTFLGA